MAAETPVTDPSAFLAFAKTQMGDLGANGGLANSFSTAATNYSANAASTAFPNFWQVGCAFDTILDYFLALTEAGELTPADRTLMSQLMADAVTGYQYGIVGINADWYDDWCWWGIAAAKAFDPDYADIFGAQLTFFQAAALDLWGVVDAGDFQTMADSIPDTVWANSANEGPYGQGPNFTKDTLSDRHALHVGTRNVWSQIQLGGTPQGTARQKADYAYFTSGIAGQWAAPRFRQGCWQYDMSREAFPCQDGPDWQTPWPSAQTTLGVYQVTLMSGLYLSFCCSLWSAAARKVADNMTGGAWDRLQAVETYQQAAGEVVGFLTQWFGAPGQDSLLAGYETGVLVHERTPTYAALGQIYPPVQGYLPDTFWGGDQGLLMGALQQYVQLTGSASTYPEQLFMGVFYNMQREGMVGPWLASAGSPVSGDANDYSSGSGIFWRYVMRCCRSDPGFSVTAKADPTIVGIATTSGSNVNDWDDNNTLFIGLNTVAAAIGAWSLLK